MSDHQPPQGLDSQGLGSGALAQDVAVRRRRLIAWRVAAILAFVLAVLASGSHRAAHVVAAGPHLVRLKIAGIITQDADRITAIDAARKDAAVKGMLLEIDSPGGTVGGGVALHDALARFAAAKPVVTVMDDVGASAAYMAAAPTTRIFANAGTLTGSIGVLMQTPDFSGLLGKIGVNVDMLVSGPLKGQPSGVQPLSPAGRAMLQGIIEDYYGQFVDMVAQGRHMAPDKVRGLADGRPYTGRQALANGLIDQIGGESDARDWLASARHIPVSMTVTALPKPSTKKSFGQRVLRLLNDDDRDGSRSALGALVWQAVVPAAVRATVESWLLSGPVALWRP